MKKLFLVANWKSHKTIAQAHSYMISLLSEALITSLRVHGDTEKHIIICPPSFLLSEMSRMLEQAKTHFPLSLGAQNISPFDVGAHTGEESARQISELAKYVIIGHSERRKEFAETDELLAKKVVSAREFQLEPIFCVQGKDTPIPENVRIVAYEPLDAISTGGIGRPATPSDAQEVALFLKEERHIPYVLYGGSVTAENIHSYTEQSAINGVLVGSDSLDPHLFSLIIQRA